MYIYIYIYIYCSSLSLRGLSSMGTKIEVDSPSFYYQPRSLNLDSYVAWFWDRMFKREVNRFPDTPWMISFCGFAQTGKSSRPWGGGEVPQNAGDPQKKSPWTNCWGKAS